MCQINVEWFPFDEQTCEMKFGSWTYGGLEVDLRHQDWKIERKETEITFGVDGEHVKTVWIVDQGIDLSDYYPSVEWDILGVPGKRHEIRYSCCESPFIDLTYEIHLRRKTLFYTVNLIFPIVGISFLTALVFYLPSDGGEKISFCISILISLTVFFLLLGKQITAHFRVEIIPPTSLVIPLIGKYLLFTMVLVTLSVIVTVITLNVHNRSPATHQMPHWAKKLFIDWLPKYLCMQRPTPAQIEMPSADAKNSNMIPIRRFCLQRSSSAKIVNRKSLLSETFCEQAEFLSPTHISFTATKYRESFFGCSKHQYCESAAIHSAVDSVTFIANHLKDDENNRQVIEDWKYISMVMDRIFLILFTSACTIGSIVIIFRAPTIYDRTAALA
uniref:Uncharacterized protein n=1 Tax=Setaria digitata TaxID=48799 RepID=A0A915PV17_9BILA